MSTFAKNLVNQIVKNTDADIYCSSAFTRYRYDNESGKIDVWHNGNYVCTSSIDIIVHAIDSHISRGLSVESDYKIVNPSNQN